MVSFGGCLILGGKWCRCDATFHGRTKVGGAPDTCGRSHQQAAIGVLMCPGGQRLDQQASMVAICIGMENLKTKMMMLDIFWLDLKIHVKEWITSRQLSYINSQTNSKQI